MPDDAPGSNSKSTSVLKHACNACRARKVKCDRQSPCSTCRISGIPCHTSVRQPEKRQRILLSKKFEDEIVDIKQQLQHLSKNLAPQEAQCQLDTQTIRAHPEAPKLTVESKDITSSSVQRDVYRGSLSFSEDSTQWAKSLQREPSASPASIVLKHAISAASNDEFNVHHIQDVGPFGHRRQTSELPLPSADSVLSVLNAAKSGPQRFSHHFPFIDLDEVTIMCQKIYFPAKQFSLADYLSMHACIHDVCNFVEGVNTKGNRVSRSCLRSLKLACMDNITLATHELRLDLVPTNDIIQALLLTASTRMATDDFATAWTLLSAACHLCLDAGLHRLPDDHLTPDTRKSRLLFWAAYIIDKGLALTFGRASNIQDYDISTAQPDPHEDFKDVITGECFAVWISYAEVQGLVYQELYSAQGHRRSAIDRAERAQGLAQRLLGIMSAGSQWAGVNHTLPLPAKLMVDMACQAMLTLIYRAIPPKHPHHTLEMGEQCVYSAREALKIQLKGWKEFGRSSPDIWDETLQWTILFHPFTPFIIITNNVIVQHESADLELLQQVLTTLEGYEQRPNRNSLARLYKICTRLLRIASLSMSEYQQQVQQQRCSIDAPQLPTSTQHSDPISKDVSAVAEGGVGEFLPNDFDFDFGDVLDMPLLNAEWDTVLQDWDVWIQQRDDTGAHHQV